MNIDLFFIIAMFPLRRDNEIFLEEIEGLGYSVLFAQNTAIPKIWQIFCRKTA